MDSSTLQTLQSQMERMLADLKHEQGLASIDPDFAYGRLKAPRPCIFNSNSRVPAFFFASLEDVIEMTERSLAYVKQQLKAQQRQAESNKARKAPKPSRGSSPLRKPWE